MPTVGGIPPATDERRREIRQAHAVGQVIKAAYDSEPPEKGVTQLPPVIAERWCKKTRRYRYEKGMKNLLGKKIGGRFVSAPDYAPPERRKGHKKPVPIARLKSR